MRTEQRIMRRLVTALDEGGKHRTMRDLQRARAEALADLRAHRAHVDQDTLKAMERVLASDRAPYVQVATIARQRLAMLAMAEGTAS
jgi:hypothetical protein